MSTKVRINTFEVLFSDINFVALCYVVLKIWNNRFRRAPYLKMSAKVKCNIFEIATQKSIQIHANHGST